MLSLIFCAATLKAETSNYSFSIAPIFGFLYGQAEEIVYKDANSDVYMSELLWDLKPLFYAGLKASFGPRNYFDKSGFFINGSIKFGFPLNTGNMEDRDWQYPDNSLTNFSCHDLVSLSSITAGLSAGYSFRVANFLSIGAYLDFLFMQQSWSASDGYYQYLKVDKFNNIEPGQVWTDDIPKEYLTGEIINYKQDWFIFAPFVLIKGRVNHLLSLEAFFGYSPLIYCSDRDLHVQRGITYRDNTSFGHFLSAGGSIIISPLYYMDLFLTFSYKNISGSRGDVKTAASFYEGIAGTGYSAFDVGLIAVFYINDLFRKK